MQVHSQDNLHLCSFFHRTTTVFNLRDKGPGRDNAYQSLRDVFNDVSKYMRIISISLNRLVP